jgi:hypothetical protein
VNFTVDIDCSSEAYASLVTTLSTSVLSDSEYVIDLGLESPSAACDGITAPGYTVTAPSDFSVTDDGSGTLQI